MPGFMDFLIGNQSKMKPFNKESLQSLLDLIQSGGGLQNNPTYQAGQNYLQGILSDAPNAFSQFEAPFQQQFQQQTVPGIAERFAGMGTGGGAMSSSGLNNSLAQAGSSLQTQLAALRSGLKGQAAQQGLQYSQAPIQNLLQALGLIPGQYNEIPGQGGFLQGAFNSFANGAGRGLTGGF